MEIILREPRFDLGEEYRIKITETGEAFLGANIGFFIFDHIVLYEGRKTIIEAKRRFRPLGYWFFDITYKESKGYFKQLSSIKPSYELNIQDKKYDIIEHWGKKVSIFLDGVQIASIIQLNDISFNNNDTFQLLVNDDADFIPLMLAAMILDSSGNGGISSNLLTIDLGNVSGEKRPFDTEWKPKTA